MRVRYRVAIPCLVDHQERSVDRHDTHRFEFKVEGVWDLPYNFVRASESGFSDETAIVNDSRKEAFLVRCDRVAISIADLVLVDYFELHLRRCCYLNQVDVLWGGNEKEVVKDTCIRDGALD